LASWNLIMATLDLIIYISLGIFAFKINFKNVNLLSTIIILFLTIASFSGLGILSASFIIILKRGNPISWIINSIEGLIGGVYFPITVLPHWLQFASQFLPITYAIKAVQLSVFRGYSVNQLLKEIVFLLLFSCLLLPLSLKAFTYSLKKARRDGSLSSY